METGRLYITDTVYLFGRVYMPKTQEFKSCCVQVRDMERVQYLLLRNTVRIDAVGK